MMGTEIQKLSEDEELNSIKQELFERLGWPGIGRVIEWNGWAENCLARVIRSKGKPILDYSVGELLQTIDEASELHHKEYMEYQGTLAWLKDRR